MHAKFFIIKKVWASLIGLYNQLGWTYLIIILFKYQPFLKGTLLCIKDGSRPGKGARLFQVLRLGNNPGALGAPGTPVAQAQQVHTFNNYAQLTSQSRYSKKLPFSDFNYHNVEQKTT